jgi:hypothetical protein
MKLGREAWTVLLLLFVLARSSAAAALSWTEEPGCRFSELAVGKSGAAGFVLVPPQACGITFIHALAQERHLTNQMYLNGSGVACGDVDGDGWCDLYFCNLDGPNQLYRNLGGWKFQDITASAGVSCSNLDSTGAAFADLDGDGDLDLVVNSLGQGTHVFLNDGKGRFTESRQNGVLNPGRGGMSMALADIDGDGALDLYVANYRTVTIRDQPNTRFTLRMVAGHPEVALIDGHPLTEPHLTNRFAFKITSGANGGSFSNDEFGEADVLYRNDGHGNFSPVSWTDGTFLDETGQPLAHPPFDWGLSVMFRDLNGDGAPDIYVCNDFKTPDRIWINNGKGQFRAIAPLALRETSMSSMGLDFADINRDGLDDFFVVDMLSRDHQRRYMQRIDLKPDALPIGAIDNRPQCARNTLFLNRGDGTYAEIAQLSGLEASEWSWTPIFLDVDLDGYEDLLVANGFERDGMNVDVLKTIETMKAGSKLSTLEQLRLRKIYPRLDTANLAFRNLGNLKFSDMSAAWGFNQRGVSQGMALADLDNDGDLDVVVCNLNTAPTLYRNEIIAPRLAVRLKGRAPNTRGIGAKIKVFGGPVTQSQEIIAGGRYLSSDDPMRVFAAGPGEMRIEVNWRSGRRSSVSGVKPNRIYEIAEESGSGVPPALPPDSGAGGAPTLLFKDVSELISHTHHEEPFDDFAQQPLLPNRLSQLGPGVTWFDLDGDGWEDLIIGSGKGGQLAAFHNDGHGGFQRVEGAPFAQTVTRDQTTVLGWRPGTGPPVLLAGSANYEDGLAVGSVARRFDLAGKTVLDELPGQASSTGPMALADIDGDGELDVFIGGRVVPGRYAEPASSLLFRGAGGKLVADAENTRRLANVGLVSGAVFSDIDGDGDPDLILACEWGPVRVFRNDQGRFNEVTGELGFTNYLGWWNGVATGDFDGDGRLDIVASNWGRNTKYESVRSQPLRLYYGELGGGGMVDVIEACFDASLQKLVPSQPLHRVSAALPALRERFPTAEAYARSSLMEVYGDQLKAAKELRANWLDSTLFLNRGDHFEARPLPLEAQFAPAFAVCVGDIDGDGNEDVFLSQNFFAVQSETSRYDAGRGLLLKGDGKGGFRSVPGQESGIRVYGEQRGSALCDYDGDGRVDLAVSQNGAGTILYRNLGARPGLRVRLIGPPGNLTGIGATLRLARGATMGPAREIHAGSGYWSQDGAVQVLAGPEPPTQLRMRWPGGKEVMGAIPSGAREISVDAVGRVVVLH